MSLYELNDGFKNYLNQKFTPGERQQFMNWLSSPENEEKVKQYLYDQLKDFSDETELKDVDFDSIYSNINDKINLNELNKPEVNKTRELLNITFKVAAVFLAVVVSVFLTYTVLKPQPFQNAGTTYYEIKAPLGAKTEITMPDGSKVLLNAGSKLKYNAGFNINNRELSLDGEAFFNVHKNKNLPFIVKTSYIDIKAVGTAFNVKAYNDEGTIETTL
ncbi:MAG: FecR domain-containing protein, partial [Bacteroidales bacterium]|nr:FecR domain-containing protein [Bacteroidales bacterium]